MDDIYRQIHNRCGNNMRNIHSYTACGCFHCGYIFLGKDIEIKIDEGRTALCPRCGIDSVIYEDEDLQITLQLLYEMRTVWFYESDDPDWKISGDFRKHTKEKLHDK